MASSEIGKSGVALMVLVCLATGVARAEPLPKLRVSSDNRHYLQTVDGNDFFWLGNMPWELGGSYLDESRVIQFLDARAAQGHTVVSLTANNNDNPLWNTEQQPFSEYGPVVFNEEYWEHIDFIIDAAEDRGLYVVLAAMWGWDADLLFDDPFTHNYEYGFKLGQRYGGRSNVIFCAAGEYHTVKSPDRTYPSTTVPITAAEKELIAQIGKGLRDGSNGQNLITVHGAAHAAKRVYNVFNDQDWCDFYLEQPYKQIDLIDGIVQGCLAQTTPVIKPCVVGESGFWENFTDVVDPVRRAWVQRLQNWWAIFQGACGSTYGGYLKRNWPDGLNGIAAGQMRYLKDLILSKPVEDRVPDQSLVTSDTRGSDALGEETLRLATRARDKSWAYFYSTQGGNIGVVMSKLASGSMDAFWYNPRTGKWRVGSNETVTRDPFLTGIRSGTGADNEVFDPPGSPAEKNDWVLVLEATLEECSDGDGDGYGNPPSAACDHAGKDCDDDDASVHPGATELCNGEDDDCDGKTDEDFDLSSDPENCGSCGNECSGLEVCNQNICTLDCAVTLTACAGACVDIETHPEHCGGCGHACESAEECVDGSCVPETQGKCDDVFQDVDDSHWAADAIYTIYRAGVTAGCSQDPLRYCGEATVTRAMAAVLLGRALHGAGYSPPPVEGIFQDVEKSTWAAPWIEQLYRDGLTAGCAAAPLRFCPDSAVTRTHAAIFLLRAIHGTSYAPPSAAGIFSDMPTSHWGVAWAEQLYGEGITAGCDSNPLKFCPDAPVSRAAMAVLMVRAIDSIAPECEQAVSQSATAVPVEPCDEPLGPEAVELIDVPSGSDSGVEPKLGLGLAPGDEGVVMGGGCTAARPVVSLLGIAWLILTVRIPRRKRP